LKAYHTEIIETLPSRQAPVLIFGLLRMGGKVLIRCALLHCGYEKVYE
jgi:hypothetical protein